MSDNKAVSLPFGDKECQILPYDYPAAPEIMRDYKKLDLSAAEKARIAEIYKRIQSELHDDASSQYYIARWSDGMPSIIPSLMVAGGAMGALLGAGGKAAAAGTLTYTLVQAGFSLLYAIMQFFLFGINRELTVISQKIDEILEFLYGDKKAELLSAIHFTRYAFENYSSITDHEGQRYATIQSLQSARMTAIQDVEFYLTDLHSAVSLDKGKQFPNEASKMEPIVNKVIQSSECLDLSIQLCMTAHLLEIYYSQNYDSRYLRYVENDVGSYISRWEKQMIGDYNTLRTCLKTQWQKKADWDKEKERVHDLIRNVEEKLDPLMNDKGNKLKAQFAKALRAVQKETECCISADGSAYLRIEE